MKAKKAAMPALLLILGISALFLVLWKSGDLSAALPSVFPGNGQAVFWGRPWNAVLQIFSVALSFFITVHFFLLAILNGFTRARSVGMFQSLFFLGYFLFLPGDAARVFFPALPEETAGKFSAVCLMGAFFFIAIGFSEMLRKKRARLRFGWVPALFPLFVLPVLFLPGRVAAYPLFPGYALAFWFYADVLRRVEKADFSSDYGSGAKGMRRLYILRLVLLLALVADRLLSLFSPVPVPETEFLLYFGFACLGQAAGAYGDSLKLEGLREMKRLRDDFIPKLAYRYKALVSSIVSLSKSTLKKADSAPRELIENTAMTRNLAQQLLDGVDLQLDLSLIRQNRMRLNPVPVDLKVCVDLAAESCEKLMAEKSLGFHSGVSGSVFALGDESRVRQILMELILNAVKNTDHGMVTVKAWREGDRAVLSVEDTGCGIPAEEQDHIFAPYVSLDAESGGLGLFLGRSLAELMGGALRLDWTAPQRGSRFVLELPASDERPAALPRAPRSDRPYLPYASAEFGGREKAEGTVLVADDEVSSLQTAAEILRGAGYHVLTALSGREALRIAESRPVDLVILDILMPGSSGIAVCRKIREQYSLIELPVLLSTVGGESCDLEYGMKAGANDFIAKPFEERELLARVRTLTALKSSMEQALHNEMMFLHMQIKPHFLYNTINTIISFCYTDPQKAAELLTNFSKYLRLTFDIDQKLSLVPLGRELEMVRAYLEIQKARFGDGIAVSYEIDPALLEWRVPPLCIQPLVENAVKHGLHNGKTPGGIRIRAGRSGGENRISVSDTGSGMKPEKLKKLQSMENTGGVGLLNVQKRIRRWPGASFSLSSREGRGTTAVIAVRAPKEGPQG